MFEKIIDISPLVSASTVVFPGDVAYSREQSLSFSKGDHLTLSSIRSTLHIGAHADAPIHYHAQGAPMQERDLHFYLGDCQVIDVNAPRGERILPEHLAGQKILAPRILLKTSSFPDPERWNSDFNSCSPELIDFLARQQVILVGIDTPSVDPETSKSLESHQEIFKNNMAILEGLVLHHVKPGNYILVALPLRLQDADASPVRAILLEPKLA